MKRFANAAFAASFALACCLIATGCDRKDSVTDAPAANTSQTDSTLVTNTVGDRVMDAPFQTIALSTELLETVPGNSPVNRLGGSPSDLQITNGDDLVITSVLSYSYADGWHVFDFEAVAINHNHGDTVDIAGTDSVQVQVDGSAVQQVDDTTMVDGLLARAHLGWSARSGNGEGALHHSLDVAVEPMGLDTLITIDGFAHDSLSGIEVTDSASCALDLSYDLMISNLQVLVPETTGDCPEAGDLSVAVGIAAECVGSQGTPSDSVNIHGTWTVTAHVNDNNTVTVTFSNGLLFFRKTTSCDDSGTTGSETGWWTGATASSEQF